MLRPTTRSTARHEERQENREEDHEEEYQPFESSTSGELPEPRFTAGTGVPTFAPPPPLQPVFGRGPAPQVPDMLIHGIAETLGAWKAPIEVPNNPGPYQNGQGFPRWRKYVLRFCKVNQWSRDQLIDRMAMFLDGPAWTTFERMHARGALPITVEGILDAIGAVHCDLAGSQRESEGRLYSRYQRPGESMYDFLAVFETLAVECDLPERVRMQTFISHVLPEHREMLIRARSNTWAELRSAALVEQQVLDCRRAGGQTMPVHHVMERGDLGGSAQVEAVNAIQHGRDGPTQHPRDTGDSHRPDPGIKELVEAVRMLLEIHRVQLQQPQPQEPPREAFGRDNRRERRCFECGGQGHIARDCRRRGNGTGARTPGRSQAP